jgi:hypothetical protein
MKSPLHFQIVELGEDIGIMFNEAKIILILFRDCVLFVNYLHGAMTRVKTVLL